MDADPDIVLLGKWPATAYSQGPGWYTLRIETDQGVEEHIVRDPRERVGPREVAELREIAVVLHTEAVR